MFFPAAQCSQLAGSRAAGIVPAAQDSDGQQVKNTEIVSMKKLVVFDLDGTLAPSKAVAGCRDGGADE